MKERRVRARLRILQRWVYGAESLVLERFEFLFQHDICFLYRQIQVLGFLVYCPSAKEKRAHARLHILQRLVCGAESLVLEGFEFLSQHDIRLLYRQIQVPGFPVYCPSAKEKRVHARLRTLRKLGCGVRIPVPEVSEFLSQHDIRFLYRHIQVLDSPVYFLSASQPHAHAQPRILRTFELDAKGQALVRFSG